MSKRLICTVGLPRSGKTTWARKQGFPIVNPDSIRLAMHGQRFLKESEPWVWATAHCMVKALFLAGHDAVILDACLNTKKRRDEWLSDEWGTEFVFIDTPPSMCIERAEAEGDEVIIPVIMRMATEFEPLPATKKVCSAYSELCRQHCTEGEYDPGCVCRRYCFETGPRDGICPSLKIPCTNHGERRSTHAGRWLPEVRDASVRV